MVQSCLYVVYCCERGSWWCIVAWRMVIYICLLGRIVVYRGLWWCIVVSGDLRLCIMAYRVDGCV